MTSLVEVSNLARVKQAHRRAVLRLGGLQPGFIQALLTRTYFALYIFYTKRPIFQLAKSYALKQFKEHNILQK